MQTTTNYHIAGGASTDATSTENPTTNDTTNDNKKDLGFSSSVGKSLQSASDTATKSIGKIKDVAEKKGNIASKVASTADYISDTTKSAYNAAGTMKNIASKATDAAKSAAQSLAQSVDVLGVYPTSSTTPSAPKMLQDFSHNQQNKNKNKNKPNVMGNYNNSKTPQPDVYDKEDVSDSDDDNVTFENIAGVTRKAGEKVYDSGSNLLITQFTLMLDKTIDLVTYFSLGYRSLNSVDKEEIINNLKGKRDMLMQIAYDPVGQQLVKDMSFALATIISEIIDAAGPQLSTAQQKLTDTIGSGFDKVSGRMMQSIRNMIRILPGAGDAFIIMENVFKIGQIATDMGKTAAKTSQTFANTYNDIREKTIDNPIIKEQLNFFSNSTKEFQHLRNKIAGKIGDDIPNKGSDDPDSQIKTGIKNTGKKFASDIDATTNQIQKQQKEDILAQSVQDRKERDKRRADLRSSGQSQSGGKSKGKGKKGKKGKIKHYNKYVFRTRKKCHNGRKINKLTSTRKRLCN